MCEHGGPPHGHKTIAVLLDHMTFTVGGYESELREALHARGRELGVNLLLVFGSPIAAPDSPTLPQNGIFELIRRNRVDGVIAVSTLLATHCGERGIAAFLERYRDLPLCSVGLIVPGVPSIVVDGKSGIRQATLHLIEVHGSQKPAFIGGPPGHPESEERLEAYRAVLEQRGLAWEPARVASGQFRRGTSRKALEELIERGVDFDAVVAASDAMALGCIEALTANRALRARNVPVTGFDNWSLTRLGPHALTTVAQPFGAIADRALGAVLDQIAGRRAPAVERIQAAFVVRRSCGCGVRAVSRKSVPGSPLAPRDYLAASGSRLTSAVAGVLSEATPDARAHALEMVIALQRELEREPGAFVRSLEELVVLPSQDGAIYGAIEDAICLLRNEFRCAATPELEELWFEGLAYVAQVGAEAQSRAQVSLHDGYHHLLSTTERVGVALNVPTLRDVMINYLPEVGINTAAISRFCDASRSALELLVCVRDGEAQDPSLPTYPAELLVPQTLFLSDQRLTLAVFPLTLETLWLGIAAFEYTARTTGYQMVRERVGTALRTIALHQEVVDTTNLHERSVQIRQATARRMDALSVLAGGVAHDLNNALGPLVALPEIIVRELEHLGIPEGELERLRSDVQSIESASLRARQTIRDLLTLGRQGTTEREPCDLNRVAGVSVAGDALRVVTEACDRVKLVLELHPEPLVVEASEAHLVRAVTNLVINALQAVSGPGQVVIKTFDRRLAEPAAGYETIGAGDYAVVSVSDSGVGIAPDALGHVFEPFYSGKLAGEYAGTGLGLAIVHGVVKEHAGFVDVTSAQGRGTTFTLYFPRSYQPAKNATVMPPAARGRARVLLVDDDPMQARTARRVLKHLGYTSDVLTSGKPAFELFVREAEANAASPYDVVIFDMILNEALDGLELYEKIHLLYPNLPAIMASGHAPNERAERAFKQGLRWLAKPYTIDALSLAVETAMAEGASPKCTMSSSPPASDASLAKARRGAHAVDGTRIV